MKPNKHGVLVGKAPTGASPAGWHSIADFLRCPKEFQFKHLRKLRAFGEVQMPEPFAVGQMVHAGRAAWFSTQCAPKWEGVVDAALDECVQLSSGSPLPISSRDVVSAKEILKQYVNHWGLRPKPVVKAVEYGLGPAPMQKDDPFWLFRTARLDDLSEYHEAQGALCIGECKTTRGPPGSVVNEYTLHGQPLMYSVLWEMAQEGKAKFGNLAWILLDVIQKPEGRFGCKFGRFPLPITAHAREGFIQSMRGWLRAAASVTPEGEAPRNYTACIRPAGGFARACEFRELCRYGKDAGKRFVDADGVFAASTDKWK